MNTETLSFTSAYLVLSAYLQHLSMVHQLIKRFSLIYIQAAQSLGIARESRVETGS